MPARKIQQYYEGDVFAVTLRDGRFARGVVARIGKRGIALGYFFGPAADSSAELPASSNLRAADAIYVCIFGDLRIINGTWAKVSSVDPWDRGDWPVPTFCRNGHSLITYDDNLSERSALPVAHVDCVQHAEDGLAGAGFVEIRLTRLLAATGDNTGDTSELVGTGAAHPNSGGEPETIEVTEVEPGRYHLRLSAGTTSVDDLISELGHEPNGSFWEGIVDLLVASELPEYDGKFESDAEASAYHAYSDERSVIDALARRLRVAATDNNRLRQLVYLANARGFEFDD